MTAPAAGGNSDGLPGPTPQPATTRWAFAAGNWNAQPDMALPGATGRSMTWRLIDDHEAAFTIDGSLPEAAGIQEMVDDLWVYRNGTALFRGRIGPSSDAGDSTSLTTGFSAAGYRTLLQRRYLYEGDTLAYTSTDQAAIAWGLLTSTQSKAAGDLGIAQGLGAVTGVVRDRTQYNPGQSIGEAINQLAAVGNGFDWDITPRTGTSVMRLDVFYPQRGTDRQRVLDFPGNIASYGRQVDPGSFANAVRGTGVDGLAAVRAEEPAIASDLAGRWDAQLGDTNIVLASTLALRTAQELTDRQVVYPSWSVVLQPGGWGGPDDIWLGDPVTLSVHQGRLNVVESIRVMEIALALDDSDNETVTLTLGTPPPKSKWKLRRLDRRLIALERR